jgi:cell division protein DivIC
MSLLSFVKKAIFNRYLLALAAFVVWMLFFDKNDFFIQMQRYQELKELNEKIDYYKSQITYTQAEIKALENDPGTLEKYAREKYFMKRSNEEIFVVAPQTAPLPDSTKP